MKFTQEIKDNWLTALKSGKYTQGYTELEYIREEDNVQVFCCIGVLGDITEGLDNDVDNDPNGCPYKFLEDNIGYDDKENLWRENDKMYLHSGTYTDDYSNVIPLIEALEVQE